MAHQPLSPLKPASGWRMVHIPPAERLGGIEPGLAATIAEIVL